MPKLLSQSELVNYLLKYGYLWTQRAAEIFLSIDRKHFTASSPYDDVPARTLCDQTISAPSIHALSFELLLPKLEDADKALDIGCGSGYFSVLLARSNKKIHVYGCDIYEPVVDFALKNIMEYDPSLMERISLWVGDGWKGSPENAPFDAIYVGAAASSIPQALLRQLKLGGRMIIPIQQEMESQTLVQVDCVSSVDDTLLEVIRLDGDSRQYTVTPITPVMFVPLIKRDDP